MTKQCLNFAMNQVTSLKYFLPLVREANKRDIQCGFFLGESGKYNCVNRNFNSLVELAEQNNFLLAPFADIKHSQGPVFFTEDHMLYECPPLKSKKYVITTMIDFAHYYNKPDPGRPGIYVDYCDHVIFPSKFFAEHYDTLSEKNLYLGSPKYDVEINDEEVYQKYDLDKNKKMALVVFPRIRDVMKVNLQVLYHYLHALGYTILVKTRGKDPTPPGLRGDHYFEDNSWFPHTSMELIKVSDFVLNFSSTVIKECIMLKKPIINIHIKPYDRPPAHFLYKYSYCKEMRVNFSLQEFKDNIDYLVNENHESSFEESIKNHLFNPNDVCKNILDSIEF
tara:strand:- start:584 stop:1591 length:1008 start_codon:yes stop_codon:yes gene_type:complete